MDFLLVLMIFNFLSSGLCGFWDESTSNGDNCSHVFSHGKVQSGCLFACSYYCDYGYEKGIPHITYLECTINNEWAWKSTNWHQIKDLLCQPKPCQKTIPNGQLSSPCAATVGSTCEYSCNTGFVKNFWSDKMYCDTTTYWNRNPHTLCTNDQQCPYEILNGELGISCTRSPGDTCAFGCHEVYMSTDPSMTITCDSDSNWDKNLSALCTKIVCPLTIPNGEISSACVGKRGYNQKCYSYGCSSGYEKPRQAVTLTCNKSAAWDWDKALSESPCLNSKDFCPKIIRNGRIDQFCDRKHGSRCTFICNEGCTKYNPPGSSRFKLTCKDNGEWNVPSYGVCRNCAKTTTAITAACPTSIPNGGIDPSCNNRHFHECHYHCVGAYSPKYERLYCTSLGYWENGAEACVDGRTPTSDEIKSSAPIIGGVVGGSLGILAITIVIVVICCIRGGPCKRSHEEPGTVITYHGVASNAPEGGVVPSAPNLSEMPSHEVRRTDAVTPSAPIDQIPGYEKPPPSYVEVVADPRKFNT